MNQLKHKLTCLETLPASEVTDRDGDTTNIVVA
jgi:hypothetical protein